MEENQGLVVPEITTSIESTPAKPSIGEIFLEGQYQEMLSLLLSSALPLMGATAVFVINKLIKEHKNNLSDLKKFLEGKEDKETLIANEDLSRIKDILSQVAFICDADRVTLGVFHNGIIGSRGVVFDKITIIAGYTSPGILKLPELGKEISASVFLREQGRGVNFTNTPRILSKNDVNPTCQLYFTRRDIDRLFNIRLSLGNLDLGVISIHWCGCAPIDMLPPENSRGYIKMEELKKEIISIIKTARDRDIFIGD